MSAARPRRATHQHSLQSRRRWAQYRRTSNLRCQYFQPEGKGCGPNDIGFQPLGEIVAVEQHRQPPQIGYDLMQKLEPFAVEIGILARQSGEIAARMRQTSN